MYASTYVRPQQRHNSLVFVRKSRGSVDQTVLPLALRKGRERLLNNILCIFKVQIYEVQTPYKTNFGCYGTVIYIRYVGVYAW